MASPPASNSFKEKGPEEGSPLEQPILGALCQQYGELTRQLTEEPPMLSQRGDLTVRKRLLIVGADIYNSATEMCPALCRATTRATSARRHPHDDRFGKNRS